MTSTEATPRISGYFVGLSDVAEDVAKYLKEKGFLNLKTVKQLNAVTRGEYKNTIRSLKRKEENTEERREKRKLYYAKPEVKERMKKYNDDEKVKERKKEQQRRRANILKKLRNVNPDLYYQLSAEDSEQQ